MTANEAIRRLKAAGYILLKITRSAHYKFVHPQFPDEAIVVSLHGSGKELSPGVEAIVRKALRNKR